MTRAEPIANRIDRYLSSKPVELAGAQRFDQRWRMSLNHGTGLDAGLFVHDERWLAASLPLAGTALGRWSAWELAQFNSAWTGQGKVAANLDEPGARFVIESPLTGQRGSTAGEPEACLKAALAELEHLASWVHQGADAARLHGLHGDSTAKDEPMTAPADALPRLRELIQSCASDGENTSKAGWITFDRPDAVGLELDCAGDRYAEASARPCGDGAEVRVELLRGVPQGAGVETALGRMALVTSSRVRMVRGGVRAVLKQGAQEWVVELAARFTAWPSAEQMDQALAALSVACRLAGAPEARALMDRPCAERFLMRIEPWSDGRSV